METDPAKDFKKMIKKSFRETKKEDDMQGLLDLDLLVSASISPPPTIIQRVPQILNIASPENKKRVTMLPAAAVQSFVLTSSPEKKKKILPTRRGDTWQK